jgi:hypothetical protein
MGLACLAGIGGGNSGKAVMAAGGRDGCGIKVFMG